MLHNWARWIRTIDCRSQSPVPYRLAIAQYLIFKKSGWVVGFEPTTSRTTIWRADQLHHTHHNVLEGIRTPDPRLRRPLLYPTELQTHLRFPIILLLSFLNKAGDGNRTHVSSLEGWCSTIELHPQIILFA